MAKLLTPMLGFGARGQIAHTVVAYMWKGIHCLRHYVIPNDPKTVAQLAQRQALRAAVNAWMSYLATPEIHPTWNRLTEFRQVQHSGYNEAISALTKRMFVEPKSSFVTHAELWPPGKIRFTLKDMDDGGNGTEAGLFAVYAGVDNDSIKFVDNYNMTGAGTITTDKLGDVGALCSFYVFKEEYRSGVYHTILA